MCLHLLCILEEVTVSHNRISGKLEFPEEFDGINIVNLRLSKSYLFLNACCLLYYSLTLKPTNQDCIPHLMLYRET